MNWIGKIAVLLGSGLAVFSVNRAMRKTKNAVCSPLMQVFFDQAAAELKSENPNRVPTEEEIIARVGKKVSKFQNRK